MNREDLAQSIARRFHLRRYIARDIVDHLCAEIAGELRSGERVYLERLGAFHAVTKKARRYRDPRTGRMRIRPAYRDVDFRPGRALLRQIARGRRARPT